jgi:hypothetical protein
MSYRDQTRRLRRHAVLLTIVLTNLVWFLITLAAVATCTVYP